MKRLFKLIFQLIQGSLDSILIAAARLNIIDRYQPLLGYPDSPGDRPCLDRWKSIEPHLPQGPFSLLDVGSQVGFLTLTAAKRGGVCLGLERVWQYQSVAEAVRRRNKIANASFLNMEVNQNTVRGFPRVDVLLCLSVFHHWVIDWGFSGADQIFTQLCNQTTAIAFEVGQFDEVDQPFAKKMEFMGQDSKSWINTYIGAKGFNHIQYLGQFSTHLGPHPRHLFYAEKRK